MNEFVGVGGIDTAEHSAKSGSKKTIQGPLSLAANPAIPEQSIAGISIAAGSPLVLQKNKTYRVVGTGDWNLRMFSSGTTAPVVTAADALVAAKTAIIVKTDLWDTIATLGAGTIQATELA